jgi:hypothetical protein
VNCRQTTVPCFLFLSYLLAPLTLRHSGFRRYVSQKFLACFSHAFTLVSRLAYSSTLNMDAMYFSETSVDFQRTTRLYILEGSALHNHRCENLKPYFDKYTSIIHFYFLGYNAVQSVKISTGYTAMYSRRYNSLRTSYPTNLC